MKKNILYTTLALALLGAVASSCSREEKNLFGESAAERLQNAQDKASEYLTAAPNGWEMLYFPYEDAAGYALLCKFEKDGSVKFAAKNRVSSSNRYKEEVSLWGMDANQGPVLTLHSYNSLVSIFAAPGDDGVGYFGDYEFVVLSGASAERMTLKGKKHGARIEMLRMPTSMTWAEYFGKIDAINADVFDNNEGTSFNYEAGDVKMTITYEDDVIKYSREDPKRGEEKFERGFIVTPTGIHFYSGCPASLSDSTVVAKNFVVNDDKSALVCIDENINAQITSQSTSAEFITRKLARKARWVVDEEGSDEATVAAIQDIKEKAETNGAIITRIAYERYETASSSGKKTAKYAIFVSYTVENKVFEGRIEANMKVNGNDFTCTYNRKVNGLSMLMQRLAATEADAVKLFTDVLCGTFEASPYSGSLINQSQLILTNKADPTRKIHIKADGETL